MSTKKETVKNEPEAQTSLSDLDQLREIVFGDAKRILQTQQQQMFKDLQQQISNLGASLNASMEDGFNTLQQEVKTVDKKTSAFDIDHHERSDILKSELDQVSIDLASQSDLGASEMDKLHDKLTSDIATLSTSLQQQIAQLIAELAQVSNDLDSSKTDRKQLAELFTTVAVNLEKDDAI